MIELGDKVSLEPNQSICQFELVFIEADCGYETQRQQRFQSLASEHRNWLLFSIIKGFPPFWMFATLHQVKGHFDRCQGLNSDPSREVLGTYSTWKSRPPI